MARPLIIDTDPGIDDAIAILLALASPELDLRGLTTVAGNAGLAAVTANALAVLECAGRGDIAVSPGAERPLRRPPADAASAHRPGGLGAAGLAAGLAAAGPSRLHATAAIAAAAAPGRVALAALGPLTNIALFARAYPERLAALGPVVIMGGSSGGGNVTPAAEFNAWVDPEAMAEVLESGLRPDLVGLNVTREGWLAEAEIAPLRRSGPIGALVSGWLDTQRRDPARSGPLHDAVAIASLIDPDLLGFRDARVTVDCTSAPARGATRIATGRGCNARVAVTLDRARFAALLVGRLVALDARRPVAQWSDPEA